MDLLKRSVETTMLRLSIEPRKEVTEQFFDTREDLFSPYDSCPISPVTCLTSPISPATCMTSPISPVTCMMSPISPATCIASPNLISPGPYKLWMGDPDSVDTRRTEFRRWMGLTPSPSPRPACVEDNNEIKKDVQLQSDTDTSTSNSGILRTSSSSEGGSFSSISRLSSERSGSHEDGLLADSLLYKIATWDDGNATAALDVKLERNDSSRRFSDLVSNQMFAADGVPKTMMPSNFLPHFMRREDNGSTRSSVMSSVCTEDSVGTKRRKWLKKLGAIACVVNRQDDDEGSLRSYVVDHDGRKKPDRVKVHVFWKRSKEFAAVYMEQEVRAHEGAIWTMKFSPDGRYLASGGEDGVIRVWSVMECERTGDDLLEDGRPLIQLSHNQNPIFVVAEKNKKNSIKKLASSCIVIPPKVLRLSDEPVHQFHGHNGDILDLSWSKDKYLISSSLDKTVRLWQVGSENCLRVFRHNDFVTCVQFNPAEENFFISGSIDGKVRIWDISSCHVVDWSDITEIVTAVCFHPDGKGVVVGSITGNCRFFKLSDNCLQLDADVSLHGKKRSTCKRITGFQFSQSDPMKLLVTSADSQILVLHKHSVVHKYKGFKNVGSLISASFSKDERHIISASEDSNVFIWSHNTSKTAPVTRAKITRSYERFFSNEASVAIPWHGFVTLAPQSEDFSFQTEGSVKPKSELRADDSSLPPTSVCSTLNAGSILEPLQKGNSTTWPEENLLSNSVSTKIETSSSECKLLSNVCQNMALSPHSWGQVIVTAGCDGRIRTYCNYGLPVHS